MSITTSQGRFYDIDGQRLPSVTTILGMLNKPALVPWAAKMTAAAFKELVDAALSGSYLTTDMLDEFEAESKKAYRAKSKQAMAHGTRVHEGIAFWIEHQGRPNADEVRQYISTLSPATDAEINAAMAGFNAFLTWADSVDMEIISSEQVVAAGTYAGRYDLFARINGRTVLMDVKTSTGIYDEYWMQVAAYAHAGFDELPDAVGILRIDKETGEIEYKEKCSYWLDCQAFLALAQAFHHMKQAKEFSNGN